MKRFVVNLMILGMLVFQGCGGGNGENTSVTDDTDVTPEELTSSVVVATSTYQSVMPINPTVGSNGGVISVDSGPLSGLKINVPSGATDENITFSVSYSSINSASGLSTNAATGVSAIRITANGSDNWNQYGLFNKQIQVTLPYGDFNSSVDEESVRFYYYDKENSTFEAEGYESIDTVNNTVTFSTLSFANATSNTIDVRDVRADDNNTLYADFVAVGLNAQYISTLLNGAILDTGFRPSKNGWYIPNYGSFYKESTGGNCMGMVAFAKYYYAKGYSTNLYDNYRDSVPTYTWLDDAVAIQLASRVHNDMVWDDIKNNELSTQQASSWGVFRSIIGAFVVTNKPALMAIYEKRTNPVSLVGGHAISAYKVELSSTKITYHIYDPNYPGDDNTRRIVMNLNADGGGTFDIYNGGTTAADSKYHYNYFKHFGYRAGYTQAMMDDLKKLADNKFSGDDRFPTFTLTKITDKTTGEVIFDAEDLSQTSDEEKGVTSSGQDKYITQDTAVVIEGTVTGGISQEAENVVDNLNITTSSGTITAAINNKADGSGDGKFEFTLPLKSGENMISMLASNKDKKYSQWAAFNLLIIESQHQPSYLTVTLTWENDNSDIDLWVKEPGGDSVGYSHRAGASTINPYLDFDNTYGYGPEHYIAIEGMSVPGSDNGLYGTYTIHANYWSDSDNDYENIQAVPWNIHYRYLEYCPDPCTNPETDGFWNEGSSSGVLTSEGENGADIVLNYEEPDLTQWQMVPPSHDVMLP